MRRLARTTAMQLLYQLDTHHKLQECSSNKEVLQHECERFWLAFPLTNYKAQDFASRLISGVVQNLIQLDQLLEQASDHWKLSRMIEVDRNVLRIAAYEILWCPDIPRAASINEAIELVKSFGGQGSSSFVNGVLDRLPDSIES